ncbi:eae-like domain protein, partial [Enterobacter hormaechei subsp. steigerwaltii]
MKAVCEDRRMFIMNGVQLGYIQVPTVETDPALETIRVAVSPQEPTPATDSFLAEVRAQGVEAFANSLRVAGGHEHPYSEVANEFAAQLRKGVQS